ncbi:MAG: flagellar assembly protein FliW [Actinomycetota bacterium]
MHVETTRFGTIEARPEDLVVFPDGIPGFAGKREMLVMAGGDLLGLENEADHPTLFWLQDVVDPDLAFLTAVPWSAYPDYDIDADLDDDVFGESEPDDICVLVIVTVRRDGEQALLTTNLRAPVVIDQNRRVGKQIILEEGDWPVRAPLAETKPDESASVEAS